MDILNEIAYRFTIEPYMPVWVVATLKEGERVDSLPKAFVDMFEVIGLEQKQAESKRRGDKHCKPVFNMINTPYLQEGYLCIGNKKTGLSQTEAKLLKFMAKQKDQECSLAVILAKVFGRDIKYSKVGPEQKIKREDRGCFDSAKNTINIKSEELYGQELIRSVGHSRFKLTTELKYIKKNNT